MNMPVSKHAKEELQRLLSDARTKKLVAALGADADLYLVGGSVRDLFLGRSGVDLDFAVSLSPDEITARLKDAGIHVIPTGLKHQTVTAVPVEGGGNVELTTLRGAGMRPEGGVVRGATIDEDLRHRDFTANAMAYDLKAQKLLDPCGGHADIQAKIVRAVENPLERFSEDPLRILRLIRFAAVLEFTIDDAAFTAGKQLIGTLEKVSVERIRDEFSKIITSPRPDWGIEQLIEIGAMPFIAEDVLAYVGYEQNEFHKADLLVHTLEVVRNTEPDLILRLAALFHDVSKPETLTVDPDTGRRHFYKHEVAGADRTERILLRLRYSRKIVDAVKTLVRTHMRPIEAGAGGLRRLLRDTEEVYPQWRALKEADSRACKMDDNELTERFAAFDAALEEVRKGPQVSPLKSLAIDGNDLMAMGIGEGPEIGIILRALHEEVLDEPELNVREILLERARVVRGEL